ncbi:MAG: TRAP transporter small permease subunit [Burkholderiales bacterium]|jgi:TRAP-type C4-dicarboxylate transport system permease small subunit|uniref:TRAP transporter small permease n=1 Tax=Orrella sp. TaxID=1921583 RepID=UPI0027671F0A|nr:TRAP transporter small permease subunit [Burkholderiales bacterium]
MMMPIPIGLTVIFWASLILAVWLIFVIRDDYAHEKGATKLWLLLEDGISQALILMMLLTATLQVLARYVLPADVSVPWTEEGGRLMMVWAALWGAAALQRADDHICMTAVYGAVGNFGKRVMLIFSDLVTLVVLLPVVYWGWENARVLDIMTSISLGLPLSIFAYSVPVTGAVMIVYTVKLLTDRLRGIMPPVRQEVQDV